MTLEFHKGTDATPCPHGDRKMLIKQIYSSRIHTLTHIVQFHRPGTHWGLNS